MSPNYVKNQNVHWKKFVYHLNMFLWEVVKCVGINIVENKYIPGNSSQMLNCRYFWHFQNQLMDDASLQNRNYFLHTLIGEQMWKHTYNCLPLQNFDRVFGRDFGKNLVEFLASNVAEISERSPNLGGQKLAELSNCPIFDDF